MFGCLLCFPSGALRARRVSSAASRLPGVTSPRFALHGWQRKRGNWLLLLLDSSLPNHPGGHLNDSELSILQRSLESHPNHHVLICLHHHPVPMGSRWLDDISLDNPASLFNITDRHTNVRGVLWGHVHQHFDGERNGVKLMSTPSTCIQFTRNRSEFSIEASPPGYRWLELMPNGEITGGVERLDELPQGLNVESSGY
ncbi:MAG: hypothetical protein RPU91_16210 [Candidatus Sedimenticola sp. (ex Thyasira tokunagai)]